MFKKRERKRERESARKEQTSSSVCFNIIYEKDDDDEF